MPWKVYRVKLNLDGNTEWQHLKFTTWESRSQEREQR